MGIKIILDNRKVRHDYIILKTFEAGLVLQGSEVKSIRSKSCDIKASFVVFSKNGEAFLQNFKIFFSSSVFSYAQPEENRKKKLLLHRKEILEIMQKMKEKGLSCVPVKLYLSKGRVKAELALVKGKKKYDKRQALKEKAEKKRIRQISKTIS